MDTKRLIKLLSLTQSDNDAEALSAIRAANAMLKKAGKQWSDVIGSESAGIFGGGSPWADIMDTINYAARESAARGQRTQVMDMISSLRARGMNHGWLSTLHDQARDPKKTMDKDLVDLVERTYAAAPRNR